MPQKTKTGTGHHRSSSVNLQTRHKIAISFSLLFLAASTAFWLLFQNELERSLKEYSSILGATLAEQTAASVRELVLVDDQLGLNVELSQLVRNDNISFVSVRDVDDNPLASAGQSTPLADDTAAFTAPITVQEAIAGTVQIQLDLGAVDTFQERLRNIFLLVLGVSLVLVITTAYALARRIRNSLLALSEAVSDQLDDSMFEEESLHNETARLEHAITILLDRLQDMESRLLKTGVWERQAGDMEKQPARLAATILVVKVVNMNTAIELLHPDTLADLLQEYHFYLNQAVRLYGGQCHRLSGESVMVSFDIETCGDRHSVNALYCAGLFQSLMASINERHQKKGEQALEFRMGIHSGDVFRAPELFTGNDALDVVDGVMGKTIDITYFLCKQAPPQTLVISESASSQARKFARFAAASRNQVSMPADNISFMAYILASGFAADMETVQEQCAHILDIRQEES